VSQTLPMVYLVRHGETAWTLTAQHTGRTDLPLNEQGEREARALRARLTTLCSDRIPDASIEADDDLMEWDYGAYEGRSTVDIEVERPGWRLFRDGCPGGETLDAVGARADRVISRIRARGGNTLVVAHREILRILAMRWIGLAAIEGRRLLLATASLSSLGYDHDLTEPVVHAWNQRPFSSKGSVAE